MPLFIKSGDGSFVRSADGSQIQVTSTSDVRLAQLPLEVAYDMVFWRPYVGGGANGWETPPPAQTTDGELDGF